MLDVEFEWFDPQPDVDFHGLKTLLRQLFDADHQLFDLSALTDLILEQPLLGSTVKVDGNETDPYAFLTVLNLHEHRVRLIHNLRIGHGSLYILQEKQVIKDLTTYLRQKTSRNPSLSPLSDLLSSPNSAQIGLILTERLVNIPSEVAPPMYTMLLEEIAWALEEKEAYTFSHYLILSKNYTEVASTLDEESRPSKKKKNDAGAKRANEVFYFHPEDEVLERHSLCHGSFDYTKQEHEGHSDSKRTFQELGIRPQGSMILIEGQKFEAAVKAISEYLSPPS